MKLKLHKEFSVDVQCSAHVKAEADDSKMVEAPSSMRKGVDASRAFVACLKTDRADGLFTTVVCDARCVRSNQRILKNCYFRVTFLLIRD